MDLNQSMLFAEILKEEYDRGGGFTAANEADIQDALIAISIACNDIGERLESLHKVDRNVFQKVAQVATQSEKLRTELLLHYVLGGTAGEDMIAELQAAFKE